VNATFSELGSTGVIEARGVDAGSFLHAQLTSDVAAMDAPRTQYCGYCTPQGRLLATFLLWHSEGEFLLQLPEALRAGIQARLSKYVLRARVQLAPAERRLFGVWGHGAHNAIEALAGAHLRSDHEVLSAGGLYVTRLALDRYLVAAPSARRDSVRQGLAAIGEEQTDAAWSALDIAAGVPIITAEAQDQYIPQMVNLDLIGGVSYTKGCYSGQEIVARTHYLGRVKQRMYRVAVHAQARVRSGDPLFSEAFGRDQACGALLNVAPASAAGEQEALAVVQTRGTATLTWKSPDGPSVEVRSLPYGVPEHA